MSETIIVNKSSGIANIMFIILIFIIFISLSGFMLVTNIRRNIDYSFNSIGVRVINGNPQVYIKYILINNSIINYLTIDNFEVSAFDSTGVLVAKTNPIQLSIQRGENAIYLGMENISLNLQTAVDIALLDFSNWQINMKGLFLGTFKIDKTFRI